MTNSAMTRRPRCQSARREGPKSYRVAPFRQGLNEAGYIKGQNVAVEYRFAGGEYERLPALAADLVRRQVDVIAARGVVATPASNAGSYNNAVQKVPKLK